MSPRGGRGRFDSHEDLWLPGKSDEHAGERAVSVVARTQNRAELGTYLSLILISAVFRHKMCPVRVGRSEMTAGCDDVV